MGRAGAAGTGWRPGHAGGVVRACLRADTQDRPGRLAVTAAGSAWQDAPPADGTAVRHRLAMDALDLLLLGEPARLKRCAGHDCAWLFYDRSKNASRRWCLMSDCGTNDKVRRFRQRQRSGAGP
jgi:predicted RNA-binding Zn ribbon-like protein